MAARSLKRQRAKMSRPADAEDRLAFTAELPGNDPDHPLWRMSVELVERSEGDGERLRVRAHFRTTLAEAAAAQQAAPRLSAPGRRRGIVPVLTRGISRAIVRGLRLPLVRQIAAPLLDHDLNTWLELQISTAALDGGTRELLPAPEQLARLGIVPRGDDGAPIVESWAGRFGGVRPSVAQVSLLRLAKEQLPAPLASLLGTKPFQMAAAMVNVVEEHR